MIELLMSIKAPSVPEGQVLYEPIETQSEHVFVVPEGVYAVHGVAIGPGNGMAGGGLAWRNHIPVTPGESLRVVTGLHSGTTIVGYSALYRDEEVLLYAFGSVAGKTEGGKGGKNAHAINDGGGDGGRVAQSSGTCGGGGAGGYTGNGGMGVTSGMGGAGNGGGGGGGTVYSGGSSNTFGRGGGTQPFGQGVSGTGGDPSASASRHGSVGSYDSKNRKVDYGGGRSLTRVGCVRLIWGDGRAFPSTRTQDV